MSAAMKAVGLKFLLKDGHWIMAIVWEEDAFNMIKSHWADHTIGSFERYSPEQLPPGAVPWSVRMADIVAMHVVDLEELERTQVQQGLRAMRPVMEPAKPGSWLSVGASGIK